MSEQAIFFIQKALRQTTRKTLINPSIELVLYLSTIKAMNGKVCLSRVWTPSLNDQNDYRKEIYLTIWWFFPSAVYLDGCFYLFHSPPCCMTIPNHFHVVVFLVLFNPWQAHYQKRFQLWASRLSLSSQIVVILRVFPL